MSEENISAVLPKGWKQNVRESGLIEWVCPHGVGHPASRNLQPQHEENYYFGHGCDGCCQIYKVHE